MPRKKSADHPSPCPTVITARLISERDAATYIGMSVFYLRQARVHGRGPTYHRFGRSIRYHVADLDTWITQRVVRMAVSHA